MAAVTPVLGNVVAQGSQPVFTGTAGETIVEGELLRTSGGEIFKATPDTAANATVIGVAMAAAASGDQCYYLGTQDMVLLVGAAFTKNTWYVLSGTSGFEEYSDLTVGEYVTYLGYGNSDTNLIWKNIVTGQTK